MWWIGWRGRCRRVIGLHRLLVRIVVFFYGEVLLLRVFFFFERSSCIDDTTWYTTTNVWAESAYHTADAGCGGTDDDTFEAPLCGGHA